MKYPVSRDGARRPGRGAVRMAGLLILGAILVAPSADAGDGLIQGGRYATTVILDLPEERSATARSGRTIRITGHLGSEAGRRGTSTRDVRAVLVGAHGLLPLGRATTTRRGHFSIRIPADWSYSGSVRVRALPSKGTNPITGLRERYAAAGSRSLAVDVAPRSTGRGSSASFAMRDASGATYDACRDLTYRINPRHAPAGFGDDVATAFAMVYEATGLQFRYAGTTNRVAFSRNQNSGARATVILAWADERTVPLLAGRVAGLGGSSLRVIDDQAWLHNGGVTLNRNAPIKPGFGPGPTVGELLLHEIGHVLGLAHVDDPTQVMQPGRALSGVDRYQAGDLSGLRQAGAANGCLARQASGSPETSRSVLVQMTPAH